MKEMSEHEAGILRALTQAVAEALERKRLLGQYAVIWQDGRAVCIGPDAPAVDDPEPPVRGKVRG